MSNKIIALIRILLGLFFILSGVLKMTDLVSFHEAVERFNILPAMLINPAVIALPALEAICGLFLVLNIFKKISALSLIALLIGFTISMGINLKRGNIFDCGCLGNLEFISKISVEHILFNVVLLILLVPVFYKSKSESDIFDQLKILMTYTLFSAFVLNAGFSHDTLIHYIGMKNIKEIELEKAMELMANEKALLFDARSLERFNKGHIPGALTLPNSKFKKYFLKYNKEIDKLKPIITYCDHTKCTVAQALAMKIVQRGYSNVYTIKMGYDGYKEKLKREQNRISLVEQK